MTRASTNQKADKRLARTVLKLNSEEFIVLQLGRIVPRKGIDNVIRAIGKLKRTGTPVRLLVVGGECEQVDLTQDAEIRRLQEVAAENGASDIVEFRGRKKRDELKYYYSAADVFVTTPWYEPFGITPLESMACGTPVIGSNVGGIKYSVEDGKSGLLVPANDPDALALRIYEVLHDKTLRASLAEHGLKRVNAFFTWSRVATKVATLYEHVILTTEGNIVAHEKTYRLIDESFRDAAETFLRAGKQLATPILQAATLMTQCFRKGRKILICGNGGSASESQHLAAEFVGRFELSKRRALPAIALVSDAAVITAWSNDFQYDEVFARQVEAFGQRGDILFCFSTSGKSPNVLQAMKAALEKDMTCIALTGKGGGDAGQLAHVNIVIPSNSTPRIQELHLHVLHVLCSIVENDLFASRRRNGIPYSQRNGESNGMLTTRTSP